MLPLLLSLVAFLSLYSGRLVGLICVMLCALRGSSIVCGCICCSQPMLLDVLSFYTKEVIIQLLRRIKSILYYLSRTNPNHNQFQRSL